MSPPCSATGSRPRPRNLKRDQPGSRLACDRRRSTSSEGALVAHGWKGVETCLAHHTPQVDVDPGHDARNPRDELLDDGDTSTVESNDAGQAGNDNGTGSARSGRWMWRRATPS